MLDQSDGPLTFLNFGLHRKKEFLKDVRNAYDGIVLTGNILLYQYRSTPMVIFSCRCPFLVDPMSYLFGQPFEEFKQRVTKGPRFKPSFDRLMKGHGLIPDAFLPFDYRKLVGFLLGSEENLAGFTDSALRFQLDSVWNAVEEAKEFLPAEQLEGLTPGAFRPRFLIPPYFLYSTTNNSHPPVIHELNARILEHCWKNRETWGDMFPAVLVKNDTLDQAFIDTVVTLVRKHEFPGYCVWVEDFDERFATATQIGGLINLVRSLSANERQIVMLHGGFFSLLLYYFGVTCVCHGLAYGEMKTVRSAVKQASGPAPVRYYIFDLHRFLTIEDALVVLRERPDLICSCPVCRRVIGSDPERVTEFSKEESLAEMHFLYNRRQERLMIAASSVEEAIESLRVSLTLNAHIAAITKKFKTKTGYEDRPIVTPTYIQDWITALETATR